MDKLEISLYEILLCLSDSQDLIAPEINNHHQQVAYLAFRLCETLGLPIEQQKQAVLAALIHDIGALTAEEKFEIAESELSEINVHAFQGAKLVAKFKPLRTASEIIKYHHIPWKNNYIGNEVPYLSHIIHIADRVCINLEKSNAILTAVPKVMQNIRKQSGEKFAPELVAALDELEKKEYIWLDIISDKPVEKIHDVGLNNMLPLTVDDLIEVTYIFSQIIDFRSRFTALHSAGVASTAQAIAQIIGFSPHECKMMLIAGYLHDLGKLAVDNKILEKPGKLDSDEVDQMRMHTYYTYQLLSPIKQLKTINEWASFHHEKLKGDGYPFRIKGDNISLGSRIMAVADIFTAITEDRPYRDGMKKERAAQILVDMAENGSIDRMVVNALLENFENINILRLNAQAEAAENYRNFLIKNT